MTTAIKIPTIEEQLQQRPLTLSEVMKGNGLNWIDATDILAELMAIDEVGLDSNGKYYWR